MKKVGDIARGEIVIYNDPNGVIELAVKFENETIWLSLNQLAQLFNRDKSVISRHLSSIFEQNELIKSSVVAKNATTAADGKVYNVDYYNLDAIVSVGYRVNSVQGTQFRIWATGVLKDHIVKGYSANETRLEELDQAVKLISNTAKRIDLSGDEASALLTVVGSYNRALTLLDDYDHQRVDKAPSHGFVSHPLEYEEAMRIVGHLRKQFAPSELFGVEKDKGLYAALGAVMQTIDGAHVVLPRQGSRICGRQQTDSSGAVFVVS